MRHENGLKLLGFHNPHHNDIGIVYVSPEDETRTLLTAILAEDKLRRKHIVIVLPGPSKAIRVSTDFDNLELVQHHMQGKLLFVVPGGSKLAEMARQHNFPVYSSLDKYAEVFHQEQIDEQNKRIGQRFGSYRLVKFLGQGGFATVYLGENTSIKQQVAVKILSTSFTPEAKEKFRAEAQTLATLDHPHIIQLITFATQAGVPFLVMKYASGGTLRDCHPDGERVPLETVIDYVQQIASAVQYAHEMQIIHRDLKPENLLLNHRDEILVSDFGMATLSESLQITPETVGGTPLYMAPEQIHGKPQRASDQYALGVMIYEWLCGIPPFRGTARELFAQHLNTSPASLRTIIPELPPAVEQVILTALAKAPEDRYGSIQEMASALERASSSPSIDTNLLPENLETLYREGVSARAAGDLEQAIQLWQQVLDRDPHFRHGVLADQMKRLEEDWRAFQVQSWREEALWAHAGGQWDQEIAAWTELLKLEGRDKQAKDYLKLAQQHRHYGGMYEEVQQYLENGNVAAARMQLTDLWDRDPYYGDPLNLAKPLGLRAPRSYEQEQAAQEKARKQGEQERTRRRFIRTAYGPEFGKPWVIGMIYFCLLSGPGAAFGLFSQSWLRAAVAVIPMAFCAYWLNYRKALSMRYLLGIALLSIMAVSVLALIVSMWSYDEPHPVPYTAYDWNASGTAQVPHTEYYHIFLRSQVAFGFVVGLISPMLSAVILLWGQSQDDDKNNKKGEYIPFYGVVFIYGFIALIVVTIAILLGENGAGSGYGFDFGWYAIIPGIIAGLTLTAGLTASLPLWPKVRAALCTFFVQLNKLYRSFAQENRN